MDKLNHYRVIIQKILEDYQHLSLDTADVESALLVDSKHDQYLLLKMGWHQNNRIKRNLIHIRLKEQKIWIEEDWTEDGVATDLPKNWVGGSPSFKDGFLIQ